MIASGEQYDWLGAQLITGDFTERLICNDSKGTIKWFSSTQLERYCEVALFLDYFSSQFSIGYMNKKKFWIPSKLVVPPSKLTCP